MNYPFPKVDLHFHLDGSMLPEVTWELAQQRNIKLPAENLDDFRKFLIRTANCQNVGEYLARFDISTKILQDRQALLTTTYASVCHIAKQGLCYAEVRFAPQLHSQKELTQNDAIQAVIDGIKKAEAECPTIKVGLILCCMIAPNNTNVAENEETVRLFKQWLGHGVVAIDLAGEEDRVPMPTYAPLFQSCHEQGLPMTIHAGDNGIPQNVATAISWGARRIGHGHRSWEDPAIVQLLNETQVALEICLTSNIQCQTEPSFALHPAKKLYDAGVKVTLNTDNMVLADTCLDQEYDHAINEVGFTYNELIQMNINSIESSFMPQADKPAYIEKMRSFLK